MFSVRFVEVNVNNRRLRSVRFLLSLLSLFIVASLARAEEAAPLVQPEELRMELSSAAPPLVLDVRRADEFASGHIPSAIDLPVDQITAESARGIAAALDAPIVVYCKSGIRSKKALGILLSLGYTNVRDFGGINNWTFGTVGDLPK